MSSYFVNKNESVVGCPLVETDKFCEVVDFKNGRLHTSSLQEHTRKRSHDVYQYCEKCGNCNFQASKMNTRDLERVMRLHAKVCKNTGRTDEGHMSARMSMEVGISQKDNNKEIRCESQDTYYDFMNGKLPAFEWNDRDGMADFLANTTGVIYREKAQDKVHCINWNVLIQGKTFEVNFSDEDLEGIYKISNKVYDMCEKLKKSKIDTHNIARRYIKNEVVNKMVICS